MLGRLGFRRLLPVVQTIIYLSLIGPYSYRVYQFTSDGANFDDQLIPAQERREFRAVFVDGPTPLSVQFAGMLNLPVVLTAGLAFIPIVPEGARGSMIWLWYLTPFVALLWYGVGLCIDQRLGWVPRKPQAPSALKRFAWRIVFAFSAGLLFIVVALFALFCAKAIGGTSALDGPEVGKLMLVYIPVVCWSFFFFMVCRHGLRESKLAAA